MSFKFNSMFTDGNDNTVVLCSDCETDDASFMEWEDFVYFPCDMCGKAEYAEKHEVEAEADEA